MIGRSLALSLLNLSDSFGLNLHVIAQGRDINRLVTRFNANQKPGLNLVSCNIINAEDVIEKFEPFSKIDYIVHCAAPTASADFVRMPVKVINDIYQSTFNVLNLAHVKEVRSIVYVSSMEVYGSINSENQIKEDELGFIDLSSARSSYPEAKRLTELMCYSFFKEKKLSVKIVRPCMVYGVGASPTDGRVLNYFVKQIRSGSDIILNTDGKSKAAVLDIHDCIFAILTVLFNGKAGEVYNVSNPKNYLSIFEMASIAAHCGGVSVKIEKDETKKLKYPPKKEIDLDITKITALGWKPIRSFRDILNEVLGFKMN